MSGRYADFFRDREEYPFAFSAAELEEEHSVVSTGVVGVGSYAFLREEGELTTWHSMSPRPVQPNQKVYGVNLR
jgi:hypothetical protein